MKKHTLLEFREKVFSLFDGTGHLDQEIRIDGDLIKLCQKTFDIVNWEYQRRSRAGRPTINLKKTKSQIVDIRSNTLQKLAQGEVVKLDRQTIEDFSSLADLVSKLIDRFERSGSKNPSVELRVKRKSNALNMVAKRSVSAHAKAVSEGGRARAESLTPERRGEIARKAAQRRWNKI